MDSLRGTITRRREPPPSMSAVKKDEAADANYESLIEATRPRLRAFLLTLTGSEAAAEDLTQETCIVLWEKRGEYDPRGDFRAWAFRIAFLRTQNFRRKLARREKREIPDEGLLETIADVATERHGHDLHDEDRRDALLLCLGKLPEPQREVVLSRYQDGVSLEQLSTEAGTNRNAMAQKLFRLKRTLLRCVEKQLSAIHP